MAPKRNTRKIIKVKIADLKPNPFHSVLFLPPTEQANRDLTDSILKHGPEPIVITPGKVIIAGQDRVAACERLGHTKISAVVRNDLVKQGGVAILRDMIEDHFEGRQRSNLERARVVLSLMKLGMNEARRAKRLDQRSLLFGATRDLLVNLTGLSTLDATRLLTAAETPTAVQVALADGRLPMVLVQRIATLSKNVQEKIAAAILQGQTPKKVVKQYLAPRDRKTGK